jgi:hypothetical protein
MGANCTSCGHAIPSGQFRCGKCGAAQSRDSVEDYAALGELAAESPASALSDAPPLHLGVGAEIRSRPSRPPAAESRVFPAETTASRMFPAETTQSRRIERELRPALPEDTRDVPVRESSDERADAERESRETERRESLVPKGTFASDATPAPVSEAPEAPPVGALTAPREVSTAEISTRVTTQGNTGRIATASSSQTRKVRGGAPPYLASAILREDMAPSEPGKRVLTQILIAAGAAGAAATVFAGASTGPALVFGPLFLVLIALARIEMSYAARAMTVAVVAGAGLGAASLWRVALGTGIEGPVLTVGTTLLPAALFLRAWFRASNTARGLVAVTLPLALSWAFMTSHRGLLELGFAWDSWLPALAWYVFVLLCLLSLLAFMGDETTGGCDGWALGLFLWFGGFAMVRYAINAALVPTSPPAAALLGLVEPALAAPTAIALAQIASRALGPRGGGGRRVEQALTS